jgi:hypothetical protein
MTVKSPISQQQQRIWSVTFIQLIVAGIIVLCSYAFKEQDKLFHKNKCIYLENINFISYPLWKHTIPKINKPYIWKDTDVHVYSNAFLAPWNVPLNQVLSLFSNILELNFFWAMGIACNMETEGPSKCWYSTKLQQ